MTATARNWIDGAWRGSDDAFTSVNPATGEALGTCAAATLDDAREAIAAARRAFDDGDWRHQPRRRERVLLRMADHVEARRESLVELLVAENGKTRAVAEGEVASCHSELRFYAGLARTIFGRTTAFEADTAILLKQEPLGVAGIIVPWNAPLILLVRSLAPALAAGCTAVVKTAPQTARVSAALIEALVEADELPRGVLHAMTETGHAIAEHLVASADVDVISYTGSTEVGKQIMAAGASTLKRMNLELGGSAPGIVFPDVDLEAATETFARTSMVMAGQMCIALSRLIAHERIADELTERLAARLETMVVGNGADPGTELGPMIDEHACNRIEALLSRVGGSGEAVLTGFRPGGELARGSFMTPSLVRVHGQDVPLLRDEIFGPVLTVDRFSDEDEAVSKANRTRYGLAASVWSGDLARAQRLADRIQAGTVWLNQHLKTYPEVETGGYKQSGIGRLHGVGGLDEFLHTKCIGWSYRRSIGASRR